MSQEVEEGLPPLESWKKGFLLARQHLTDSMVLEPSQPVFATWVGKLVLQRFRNQTSGNHSFWNKLLRFALKANKHPQTVRNKAYISNIKLSTKSGPKQH